MQSAGQKYKNFQFVNRANYLILLLEIVMSVLCMWNMMIHQLTSSHSSICQQIVVYLIFLVMSPFLLLITDSKSSGVLCVIFMSGSCGFLYIKKSYNFGTLSFVKYSIKALLSFEEIILNGREKISPTECRKKSLPKLRLSLHFPRKHVHHRQ